MARKRPDGVNRRLDIAFREVASRMREARLDEWDPARFFTKRREFLIQIADRARQGEPPSEQSVLDLSLVVQLMRNLLAGEKEWMTTPALNELLDTARLVRRAVVEVATLTGSDAERLWTVPADNLLWPQLATKCRGASSPRLPAPRSSNATASHGDDFRTVHWFGNDYEFTPNQAACVRVLWDHWERGTPGVGGQTLLETAEIIQEKLSRVFRGNSAWGTMIVSCAKGVYRLSGPENGTVARP